MLKSIISRHLRHHSNLVGIAVSKDLGYLLCILWFQSHSAATFVLSHPVSTDSAGTDHSGKPAQYYSACVLFLLVKRLQSVMVSDDACIAEHISEEIDVSIRDRGICVSSGCSRSSLSTPYELSQSLRACTSPCVAGEHTDETIKVKVSALLQRLGLRHLSQARRCPRFA